MTGGILQLETYGIEDKPLIGNPEVTLFKKVYKKHSLFALQDIDIKLKGQSSFGNTCEANIPNNGDLLNELSVSIDLPSVNVYYPNSIQHEVDSIITQQANDLNLGYSEYRYIKERLNEINDIVNNEVNEYPQAVHHVMVAKTYPWLNGNHNLIDEGRLKEYFDSFFSSYNNGSDNEYRDQIFEMKYNQDTIDDIYKETIKQFYYPTNFQYLIHEFQLVNRDKTISSSSIFYQQFLTKLRDYIIQSPEFKLVKYIEDRNTRDINFFDISYNESIIVDINLKTNTNVELEPLLFCYGFDGLNYTLKSVLHQTNNEYFQDGFIIKAEVLPLNYSFIESELTNNNGNLKNIYFIGSRKDVINSLDLQQIISITTTSTQWIVTITEPLRDISKNALVYLYASTSPEDQDLMTLEGLYATDKNQIKYVLDSSNNYYQVQNNIIQITDNKDLNKFIPVIYDNNNTLNLVYNSKYYIDQSGNISPITFTTETNNIAFVVDLFRNNGQNITINSVNDISNNLIPIFETDTKPKYIYRGKYFNYLNIFYKNYQEQKLEYPIDGFPYQTPFSILYVQDISNNKLYLNKLESIPISENDYVYISSNIDIVNTTTNTTDFTIIGKTINNNFDASSNLILNNQNVTNNGLFQFYWTNNYNLIDPKGLATYVSKQRWSDNTIMYTIESTTLNNQRFLPLSNIKLLDINYDVYNNYNFILQQLQNSTLTISEQINLIINESGKVSLDNINYLKRLFQSIFNQDLYVSIYVKTDKNTDIILQTFFGSTHQTQLTNSIFGTTINQYNLMESKLETAYKLFIDKIDLEFVKTIKEIQYNKTSVLSELSSELCFVITIFDISLNDATNVNISFTSNDSIQEYQQWDMYNYDISNTIVINNMIVINNTLLVTNYSDLRKLMLIDNLTSGQLKVNDIVVTRWSISYGIEYVRNTLPMISKQMNEHYILNDILPKFYKYLMTKITNKITDSPLKKYVTTHLIDNLWHMIMDIKQNVDYGFKNIDSDTLYPNIYAITNSVVCFDGIIIKNMMTYIFDKYIIDYIRPNIISQLKDTSYNGTYFYNANDNPIYKANVKDIELSNLNTIELIKWFVYVLNGDLIVFKTLTYKNLLETINPSNNLYILITNIFETIFSILRNETISIDNIKYTLLTENSSLFFGSIKNLTIIPIEDVLSYLDIYLMEVSNEYTYNYIIDYFTIYKTEYLSFFSNFFNSINDIGLTSYNIFRNLERIASFEIKDYIKQLEYPRLVPSYQPSMEYLLLGDIDTSNNRNYFFGYNLKSYSKLIDYIDNFFIDNVFQYTNKYFSYKSLLRLENKNDTDIIKQWQQDMYSMNSITSSFEYKMALEWEIFSSFNIPLFGTMKKGNDDIIYIYDASNNIAYRYVSSVIKNESNSYELVIDNKYFYNYTFEGIRYPSYNYNPVTGSNRVLKYVYDASNNLIDQIAIDTSENAFILSGSLWSVIVDGQRYFNINDTYYELTIGYTFDASGNILSPQTYIDVSGNTKNFIELLYQRTEDGVNKIYKRNNIEYIWIQKDYLIYNLTDKNNGITTISYSTVPLGKLGKIGYKRIENYYNDNDIIYTLHNTPNNPEYRPITIVNNKFTNIYYQMIGNTNYTYEDNYEIILNGVYNETNELVFNIEGNTLIDLDGNIKFVYYPNSTNTLFKIKEKVYDIVNNQFIGEGVYKNMYYNKMVFIDTTFRQIVQQYGLIPDTNWITFNNIPTNVREQYSPIEVSGFVVDNSLNFVKEIINEVFNQDGLQTTSNLNWNLVDLLDNIEYNIPILINMYIKSGLFPPDQNWKQYMYVSMWNNMIKNGVVNYGQYFKNRDDNTVNQIINEYEKYNVSVLPEDRIFTWNETKQRIETNYNNFGDDDIVAFIPNISDYYIYTSTDVTSVNNTILSTSNSMEEKMVQLVALYKNMYDNSSNDLSYNLSYESRFLYAELNVLNTIEVAKKKEYQNNLNTRVPIDIRNDTYNFSGIIYPMNGFGRYYENTYYYYNKWINKYNLYNINYKVDISLNDTPKWFGEKNGENKWNTLINGTQVIDNFGFSLNYINYGDYAINGYSTSTNYIVYFTQLGNTSPTPTDPKIVINTGSNYINTYILYKRGIENDRDYITIRFEDFGNNDTNDITINNELAEFGIYKKLIEVTIFASYFPTKIRVVTNIKTGVEITITSPTQFFGDRIINTSITPLTMLEVIFEWSDSIITFNTPIWQGLDDNSERWKTVDQYDSRYNQYYNNEKFFIGDIGFDFILPYIGKNIRNSIYITSNNSIIFEDRLISNFSTINGLLTTPGIYIGGNDYVAVQVLKKNVYVNGVKGVVIRFEGDTFTSYLFWEITFYENNNINIVNGNNPGIVYGFSDGQGKMLIKYDQFNNKELKIQITPQYKWDGEIFYYMNGSEKIPVNYDVPDSMLYIKNGHLGRYTDLPFGFVYNPSTHKIIYDATFGYDRMVMSMLYFKWNKYLEQIYMPLLVNRNLDINTTNIQLYNNTFNTSNILLTPILIITENFNELVPYFLSLIENSQIFSKEAFYAIKKYMNSESGKYLYIIINDTNNLILVNNYIILKKNGYSFGPLFIELAYNIDIKLKLLKILKDPVFNFDPQANYILEGPFDDKVIKNVNKDTFEVPIVSIIQNLLGYYDRFNNNDLYDPLYITIAMLGISPLIDFIDRFKNFSNFALPQLLSLNAILDNPDLLEIVTTNPNVLINMISLIYLLTENKLSAINLETLNLVILFIIARELFLTAKLAGVAPNGIITTLFFPNIYTVVFNNQALLSYIFNNNLIDVIDILTPYPGLLTYLLDPSKNLLDINVLIMFISQYPKVLQYFIETIVGFNTIIYAYPGIGQYIIDPNNNFSIFTVQSTQILLHPPTSITNYTYTITGQLYGNGTYDISASSIVLTRRAWYAFNQSNELDDHWQTNGGYEYFTGNFSRTTSTFASNTILSGEWLQIKLPIPIVLSSYVIVPRQDTYNAPRRSPRTWTLVGSNNGLTWTIINNQSDIYWTTTDGKTFDTSYNNIPYSYYRIIINKVGNASLGDAESCAIQDMYFNGFYPILIPFNINDYQNVPLEQILAQLIIPDFTPILNQLLIDIADGDISNNYGVPISSPLDLLVNTTLDTVVSTLINHISSGYITLQALDLPGFGALFAQLNIPQFIQQLTIDISNGSLNTNYGIDITSPFQLFGTFDIVTIFGAIFNDVSSNELMIQLGLDTLLTDLDPSQNLLNRMRTNTYLIKYILDPTNNIIEFTEVVDLFVNALLADTTGMLFGLIVPAVDFERLKAENKPVLLSLFNVTALVNTYFEYIFPYLPDIIDASTPEQLADYTNLTGIANYIDKNPTIILSLLNPQVILSFLNDSSGNNTSYLSQLVNTEKLVTSIIDNPDLLQQFTDIQTLFSFLLVEPIYNLVREYPVVPLTAQLSIVSGQEYGNGIYKISGSYEHEWIIDPFDKILSLYNFWNSNYEYKSNTGEYIGSASTNVSNTIILGAWIQLELPNPILLTSYSITSLYLPRRTAPSSWILVGSNNNYDWNILDSQNNINVYNGLDSSFNVISEFIYKYFRLIITKIGSDLSIYNPNTATITSIAEIKFYGKELLSQTLPYPVVPLTSPSTVITGQEYGNGTYNISGSYIYDNYIVNTFDNILLENNYWYSEFTYQTNTGVYIGLVSTQVGNQTILGEWVQLELPYPIKLTSYFISALFFPNSTAPNSWTLVGSNNGTDWTTIDTQYNISLSILNSSFYTGNNNYIFKYFRLIVTKVGSDNYNNIINRIVATITEIKFYSNTDLNPLIFEVLNINSLSNFIAPSILINLLNYDRLREDIYDNYPSEMINGGTINDPEANIKQTIGLMIATNPIINIYLLRFINSSKLISFIDSNPINISDFINIQKLVELVNNGTIPFNILINPNILLSNLQDNNNLLAVLIDLNKLKESILTDASGTLLNLFDKSLLKEFIKQLSLEDIAGVVNVEAFLDISNNNTWLDNFNVNQVASDLKDVLAGIINFEVFNQYRLLLFQYINLNEILKIPEIVNIIISDSAFVLKTLFSAFPLILQDIQIDLNLIYSLISLTDITSLFNLLSSPDILLALSDDILKTLFAGINLLPIIINNQEIFAGIILSGALGGSENIINIASLLDETKLVTAFLNPGPVDILNDFSGFYTNGIILAIETEPEFINYFLKQFVNLNSPLILKLGLNILNINSDPAFLYIMYNLLKKYIDIENLIANDIGIIYDLVRPSELESFINILNINALFQDFGVVLTNLTFQQFVQLFGFLFSGININEALTNPSAFAYFYTIFDSNKFLTQTDPTLNNTTTTDPVTKINDPSFNLLNYINVVQLYTDIVNNPEILYSLIPLPTLISLVTNNLLTFLQILGRNQVIALIQSGNYLNEINIDMLFNPTIFNDFIETMTNINNPYYYYTDTNNITVPRISKLFTYIYVSELIFDPLLPRQMKQNFINIFTGDNSLVYDISNNREFIRNRLASNPEFIKGFVVLLNYSSIFNNNSNNNKINFYFNLIDINKLVILIKNNPKFFLKLFDNIGAISLFNLSSIDFTTLASNTDSTIINNFFTNQVLVEYFVDIRTHNNFNGLIVFIVDNTSYNDLFDISDNTFNDLSSNPLYQTNNDYQTMKTVRKIKNSDSFEITRMLSLTSDNVPINFKTFYGESVTNKFTFKTYTTFITPNNLRYINIFLNQETVIIPSQVFMSLRTFSETPSTLVDDLFNNEQITNILFDPSNNIILDPAQIEDGVIDLKLFATFKYLSSQNNLLKTDTRLDSNIILFINQMIEQYPQILDETLQPLASDFIFRLLFMCFVKDLFETESKYNVFLLINKQISIDNIPLNLDIRDYITIKDTSSNILYGPYPITFIQENMLLINQERLLKLKVDDAFLRDILPYKDIFIDTDFEDSRFVICNYETAFIAVNNINEYEWRDFYKQSYEVIKNSNEIIPILNTLVENFQDIETVLPIKNTLANNIILIDLNQNTLNDILLDVSSTIVSINSSNSTYLMNVLDNMDYMDTFYTNYNNIININNNLSTINQLTNTNQIAILNGNQLKTNFNTLIQNITTIGQYTRTVYQLANISPLILDIFDSLFLAKQSLSATQLIISQPGLSSQISTSLAAPAIRSIVNINYTASQQYFDNTIINPDITNISDISQNIIKLIQADSSWNTFMSPLLNLGSQLGNLDILSNITSTFNDFISSFNNSITSIITDLSNNIVNTLDNSLNVAQVNTFTNNTVAYKSWLDISLNKSNLQAIVALDRLLRKDIDDIDNNIDDIVIIIKEELGLDITLNIDIFSNPIIKNFKEYITSVDKVSINLSNILSSVNISNTATFISDISKNSQLSSNLLTLATFFTGSLPLISVISKSFPNLATIIISSYTSFINKITEIQDIIAKFVEFSNWLVEYLASKNLTLMKATLTDISSLLSLMINYDIDSLVQLYTTNNIFDLSGSLLIDLSSNLHRISNYAQNNRTEITTVMNLMSSIEIIKNNASSITTIKNTLNNNKNSFDSFKSNLNIINNTTLTISNNTIQQLPFRSIIGSISNYLKITEIWSTFNSLLPKIQNTFLSYIQSNFDRLYSILDIEDKLNIIDNLVTSNTSTLNINNVTSVRNKLNQWLLEDVNDNKMFILCIDDNDFIERNDWVMLKESINAVTPFYLMVIDEEKIEYNNTNYKIVKLSWYYKSNNNNTSNFFIPNYNTSYIMYGGIGNFMNDFNLSNKDILHTDTFFSVYNNYFDTKELSYQVSQYKDFFTDFSKDYTTKDYMDGILKDIIKTTPNSSHLMRIPNSNSNIFRANFSDFRFIDNISQLSSQNIPKQIDNLMNKFNGFVDRKQIILNNIIEIINRPVIPNIKWIDNLGHFLMDNIELYVDDQQLEKLSSDWLQIVSNFNVPSGQERGYNIMIGNIPELTTPQTHIGSYKLHIPLPFYFHKKPYMALPLVAMFNSNILFKANIRKLTELLDIPKSAVIKMGGKLNISLLGSYVYLDTVEKNLFGTSRHEYMIEQVQYLTKYVNSQETSMDIRFLNPVKDIFFMLQSNNNTLSNYSIDTSNNYINNFMIEQRNKYKILDIDISDTAILYNLKPYERTIYNNIKNEGINPFESISINFNGHDRVHELPTDFTSIIYPYERYKKTFQPGLNVYPFCLYPEEGMSTGYCNFTYLNNQRLEYTLKPNIEFESGTLKVLARSYNILRIASGIGAIGF